MYRCRLREVGSCLGLLRMRFEFNDGESSNNLVKKKDDELELEGTTND